jgi:hypothetical protein
MAEASLQRGTGGVRLLDHLVGPSKKARGNGKVDCFSCLCVYRAHSFGWLMHGKLSGFHL